MNTLQNDLTTKLAIAGFPGRWVGPRFCFDCHDAMRAADGSPIRGLSAWLEFDDAARLDGASLHTDAKKPYQARWLQRRFTAAILLAIEIVDPVQAAVLRAECEATRDAEEVES